MEIRFQNSPKETMEMNTEQLRVNFLMQGLMVEDKLKLVYSHYDRVITGGALSVKKSVKLDTHAELKSEFFLERREIGIINVGGDGTIVADGIEFSLSKLDCVYLGKGTKDVEFRSSNKKHPAAFFLLSAPAHQKHPNRMMKKEEAAPVNMGDPSTSNVRTIYKFIHPDGLKSCQLVMGLTVLSSGNVWNSVPPHTHTRRMEVYFYFDIPEQHRVFHYMGQPQETRHIVVSNHEAVVSPPWSMHFGCGTSNYGFIWGMAGENQVFSDMDPVPVATIR